MRSSISCAEVLIINRKENRKKNTERNEIDDGFDSVRRGGAPAAGELGDVSDRSYMI